LPNKIILTISTLIFPLVLYVLFNSYEFGPDNKDKSRYFGCYYYNNKKIFEINKMMRFITDNNNEKINKIIDIKTRDAIDIDKRIIYDDQIGKIIFRKTKSGYFYFFKDIEDVIYLSISNEENIEFNMEKDKC
jgi:hypothetical protein